MNHSYHFLQRLRSALVLICVLLGALYPARAQQVLVLWDDDDNAVVNRPPLPGELNANTQFLLAALQDAGILFRLSNRNQGLYSTNAPSPNTFDVVLHLNGNDDVFDVMPPSTVVNLLNYVQNLGGGFVTSENTQLQIDLPLGLGLTTAANDLSLITRSGGRPVQEITLTKAPAQVNHPIVQGLPNFFSFASTRLTGGTLKSYVSDQPTALLTDELGSVALAVRQFGQGRVVSMHHGGNFSGAATFQDANVQQLYINAIRWADQKRPELLEIIRENGPSVNGSNVSYVVRFREGVNGVGGSDFAAVLTGSLSFDNSFEITPLAVGEYRVRALNLSGAGQFTLVLNNDGSITDQSFNANTLVLENSAPSVSGPSYTVDAAAPQLLGIVTPEPILSLATRPTLSFIFSEPMDLGASPTIFLQTESNGNISLSAGDNLGPAAAARVQGGLLALYTFQDGGGSVVRDRAENGTPLNLSIANPGAVTWLEGGLRIDSPTIISSSGAAGKLNTTLPASNALTVEAWVRPANTTQSGPARLLTLSESTGSRNMTVGQDTNRYEMRLRRTTTDNNGIPLLVTGSGVAQTNLQHVVYTWNGATGTGRIFVDGAERISDTLGGNLSTWAPDFAFALGNELTENRPWLGEMFLVAIYDRALSGSEILQNRNAGPVTDPLGDGQWINPITWQASLDRSIVQADRGLAQAVVSGARDLIGNAMAPSDSQTVNIINSSLNIEEEPPAFRFVAVGSNVQFRVQVSGAAGNPVYEWSRSINGAPYAPVGINSATLTLNDVDFSDAGLYRCTISDVQAVVQTKPAQLVVAAQLNTLSPILLGMLALLLSALGAWLLRYRRSLC